jgi:hypothetical protein
MESNPNKKHTMVPMDNKKQQPTQLELNYDTRVANIPNINVGSVVESVTVSLDRFAGGTPDMFDSVYDYLELKRKYPALQQAWDHYQSVLKMCKLKEAENHAD